MGKAYPLRRWVVGALCGLAMMTMAGPPANAVSLRLLGSVSFADQSPDVAPVLGPERVTLRVRVLSPPGTPWTLTLLANSDLTSGSDVIPAGNISWVASPDPPYRFGTLSTLTPALVAQGTARQFNWVTFDFYLVNSWLYQSGTYSGTATFTLASP